MENISSKSSSDDNIVTSIKGAQEILRQFAKRNNWSDLPNVDKFDHLHEELIEMSRHLRYKNEAERIECVKNNKEIFVDGIGDLFFGTCRLANQLGVDIEEAFNLVRKEIFAKYNHQNPENKIIRK
jgi:NTP pyrophosphatase (non-canonical NTP hydrolase)